MAFALRYELVLRSPGPFDEDVAESINILLARHSARMGRTTGPNLMRVSEMLPRSDYGAARNVAMWRGDVRELVADAVVNAAMPNLLGCTDPMHPCIDNYIQGQGGPWIRNDCAIIHDIQGHDDEVGHAKITRGYRLPAKYVLHTVGPIVQERLQKKHEEELASCYRSCLELAEAHNVKSIAFCCISTGVFMFPNRRAAEIAVATVRIYCKETGSGIKVVFNVFKDEDFAIYRGIL